MLASYKHKYLKADPVHPFLEGAVVKYLDSVDFIWLVLVKMKLHSPLTQLKHPNTPISRNNVKICLSECAGGRVRQINVLDLQL